MDDASRLPETFLSAVSPPHDREFDLPDCFALRPVGGFGLRANSDYIYRAEHRANGRRGSSVGVLFDRAAGDTTVLGALIVPWLADWLGRRATLGIFYTIMLFA